MYTLILLSYLSFQEVTPCTIIALECKTLEELIYKTLMSVGEQLKFLNYKTSKCLLQRFDEQYT